MRIKPITYCQNKDEEMWTFAPLVAAYCRNKREEENIALLSH